MNPALQDCTRDSARAPSSDSDIAVTPRGTILCFYGTGSKGGFAGDRLTLARFNLEWLTDGKDSLEQK